MEDGRLEDGRLEMEDGRWEFESSN